MGTAGPFWRHMDKMGHSPVIDSFFQWVLGSFSQNITRFIELFTGLASFMCPTPEPSLVRRLPRAHSKADVHTGGTRERHQAVPLPG